MNKQVWPSLLAFNKKITIEQIKLCAQLGIKTIHYDVMDYMYVNNEAFWGEYMEDIKKFKMVPDVHLMCHDVVKYTQKFIDYGAQRINIHADADSQENIQKAFDLMEDNNIIFGLAIKHDENLEKVFKFLKQVQSVIVMGVKPGFGGQLYIESTTDKLKELQAFKKQHQLNFQVILDGGVKLDVIAQTKNYVDNYVIGSFLMNTSDIKKTYQKIIEQLKQ